MEYRAGEEDSEKEMEITDGINSAELDYYLLTNTAEGWTSRESTACPFLHAGGPVTQLVLLWEDSIPLHCALF